MEAEEKIIKILQSLKAIEPDAEFKQFAKARLLVRLPDQPKTGLFSWFPGLSSYGLRYALAGGFALLLLATPKTLTLAEKSLPGDTLYPLKQARENFQAYTLPEYEKDDFSFWQLERRAKEVVLASENNHPALEGAIAEYQKTVMLTEGNGGDEGKERLRTKLALDREVFAKAASSAARVNKEILASLTAFCDKKVKALGEASNKSLYKDKKDKIESLTPASTETTVKEETQK